MSNESENGMEAELVQDEIFGEDEDDSNEIAEALSDLISELSQEESISLFTDLTQREIRHISVLESLDDKMIQDFLNSYKKHQVANRRKGRKELLEVAESLGVIADKDENRGLADRIRNIAP